MRFDQLNVSSRAKPAKAYDIEFNVNQKWSLGKSSMASIDIQGSLSRTINEVIS